MPASKLSQQVGSGQNCVTLESCGDFAASAAGAGSGIINLGFRL